MNIVFIILMLSSIISLIFISPAILIESMIQTSNKTITLIISLLAIYSVWLAILEVVEESGISKKLAFLLNKPIKKIFRLQDDRYVKYIALNLSCNFLGLGNAATPSGIKAVETMSGDLKNTKFAMFMLLVVNSTSIQLLPTTQIGMLTIAGNTNASNIIIPTIFATFISTFVSVFLLTMFSKRKKQNV